MKFMKIVKRSAKYILRGVPVINVNVIANNNGQMFTNKNILITGGSSGIGFAIAEKCILCGGTVCITGRNISKLEAAQEQLGKDKCKIAVFDVGECNRIQERFSTILNILDGRIDIVVSNAGIYYEKDFFEYSPEDYTSMDDINLKGGYFLAQQACRYFMENGVAGNILFVSSERGLFGDVHVYGITKAGVNSLVKGLAKKYAGTGIRINAVAPGMTATGINRIDPASNLYNETVIGKRVIRPEEIAEVAAFLMCDASICINGEIIACDEGNAIR